MTFRKNFNSILSSVKSKVFKSIPIMPNAKVYLAFTSKYPKATFIIWKQIDVFKWQVNYSFNKADHRALFSSELIVFYFLS